MAGYKKTLLNSDIGKEEAKKIIIKNLLAQNIPIEEVILLTGVNKEELEKIING